MAARKRAAVRLADSLDDEPELAQVVDIAGPARAGVINRGAAEFAGLHEFEQCPRFAPANRAWGPDADRRAKLLVYLAVEGLRSGAYLQLASIF